MSMDQRAGLLGLPVIHTLIGLHKWLLDWILEFLGWCARKMMPQTQWWAILIFPLTKPSYLSCPRINLWPAFTIFVICSFKFKTFLEWWIWLCYVWILATDKCMQWFLLWCILPQQTLQANDVDWGLEWLVNVTASSRVEVDFLNSNLVLWSLPFFLNWIKRFTEFGGSFHHRPVQDLAFAVARFIQKGGSFVNYSW